MPTPKLIIVGLGPGAWEQVTLEARDVLAAAQTVYLRTRTHPTADHLPAHLTIHSFDYLYEQEAAFQAIYQTIADELLRLAAAVPDGAPVIFAVPGHPLVGEATVRLLLAQARAQGLPVRIVAGLSFLEPVCTALELDPLAAGLQILDGTELSGVGDPALPGAAPPEEATEPFYFSPYGLPVPPEAFPALQGLTPMKPLLVTQVYNDRIAGAVKLALLERYPAGHPARIVMAAGVPGQEQVIEVPLHALDRGHGINHLACVYLPPLEPLANARDLDALIYVLGRLRGPGGCPWDRKQTPQSIKHDLVEEVYEALDALDADDPDAFAEELGDVLMQVIFHAQLATPDTFTLGDVVEQIVTKLVRRHPHVFGELEVADADAVLANWQRIKGAEQAARRERAGATDAHLEVTEQLRSVPRAMPALEASLEISRRAAAAGFEWATIEDVYAKVHEELRELREAPEAARFEEFGDLLFTLVNIARWLGITPEEALRAFNRKFIARFAAAERLAVAAGHRMRDLPVAAQDRYWTLAKQAERET